MKKLTTVLLSLGLMSAVTYAQATDLIDVFNQAQQQDPTYQQAKAKYLSTKATEGQAFAKLLPNLGLTGSYTINDTTTKTTAGYPSFNPAVPALNDTKGKLAVTDYKLSLDQPLFNWANFKTYAQVKLQVKQAAATYAAAEQDLITRTADAYFKVLTAQDVLRYTEAQKRQLYRSLEVARQRYHVGLDAVTAVYDAQAKYDAMKATYIANQNDLANKKEELREITGKLYPSLAQLKTRIPLVKPTPANIDTWTQTAENQNLSLMSDRFAAQAARENIKIQFAGHLPTLDAVGSYEDQNSKNQRSGGGNQDVTTTSYGVQLTAPLFAGGGVSAQTKQAEYDYQAAVAAMDITHRKTVADTRKAYLGVLAEISQIEADRQSIKSAQAALASNEAGYKVGTQTILNVLEAQSTLYNAETKYASDRFDYVTNTLALKEAAGTLNEQDLNEVNAWLTYKPVHTNYVAPKKVSKKKVSKTTKKAAPKKRTTKNTVTKSTSKKA